MVTYDAARVQEYADRLHRSADQLVATYALGGIVTGASLGFVTRDVRLTAVTAVLVGVIGYLMGRGKAFRLKLEAQLALCQSQIEKNTRTSAPRG